MPFLKEKAEIAVEEAELKIKEKFSRLPSKFKWVLIIFLVSVIPAYFIAKIISEKYWEGKYRQFTIVASPSFTNPIPPRLEDISLTRTSPNTYAALAEIKNENLELSLNDVPVEFKFFNNQNELINTHTERIFLLPNQKKYVVVPKIETGETLTKVELQWPESLPWQKRLQVEEVDLFTSIPVFYNQTSPLAFVVEGSVENSSSFQIKELRLVFIVKDSLGNILSSSVRDEFTVRPFERRAFKQLWPQALPNSVRSVQVIAETNTLDSSNLSAPEFESGDASDLDRPETSRF